MNEKTLYVLIGRFATAKRKSLQLTQEEVAQRMGISRASLANMESGRQRILVHQLYELARALKLAGPEELLPPAGMSTAFRTLVAGDENSLPDQMPIGGADLSEMERSQVTEFYSGRSAAR